MMPQAHPAGAGILAAENHRKESLDALANARALLPRLASSAREVNYYDRAAAVYARNGQFQQAFGQMTELRDVEQRRADDANSKLASELQTRFEVQRRETENALLRA